MNWSVRCAGSETWSSDGWIAACAVLSFNGNICLELSRPVYEQVQCSLDTAEFPGESCIIRRQVGGRSMYKLKQAKYVKSDEQSEYLMYLQKCSPSQLCTHLGAPWPSCNTLPFFEASRRQSWSQRANHRTGIILQNYQEQKKQLDPTRVFDCKKNIKQIMNISNAQERCVCICMFLLIHSI